jgi:argininosuccinate lyase
VTGTGRLVGELGQRTRRVVYGPLSPADIAAELPLMLRVDRAHTVMLAEQGLVSREAAAALLHCMDTLRVEDLADRPAPRGLYLMYEGYLIERLGADVGGVLHTGRSRNDLKATMTSLGLRDWLLEFASQVLRLEAVLLCRARAYGGVVMPVYTHFQAAMPLTYGHYLLGVARALSREIDALRHAAGGLDTCPLGASAVAGTDLPIAPDRTARLLGFAAPAAHAVDAVASRDVPLRLLGAATGIAVVLSRLATDLQIWSTAEFAFVAFPDRLVGGSSAMPQKRNAFLLEHVKAKPAHAIGAYAAAASAMAATPFTNTIEVGTEAVGAVWPGLDAVSGSVLLSQVLVSGARPQPARMRERAEDGFTAATALANRLVRAGVPFRAAHHAVGDAVRRAVEAGATNLADFVDPQWRELAAGGLDDVVSAQRYGGGPGAFDDTYQESKLDWRGRCDWLAALRRADAEAQALLDKACGDVR